MTNCDEMKRFKTILRIVHENHTVSLKDVGDWYCETTCGMKPKECTNICDAFISLDEIPKESRK